MPYNQTEVPDNVDMIQYYQREREWTAKYLAAITAGIRKQITIGDIYNILHSEAQTEFITQLKKILSSNIAYYDSKIENTNKLINEVSSIINKEAD